MFLAAKSQTELAMKHTLSPVLFVLLSLIIPGAPDQSLAQEKPAATYQVFYDALAPYGKWLYDKQYGYVWAPSETNFRPYYSNGYWVMTDAGTTWFSNYPWGWAPFHYGRWVHDALYKWIWIPGNKWASAWVVWKTDGQYAGWVPILP